MKPAIAVLGGVWSDDMMAQLDEQFLSQNLARMAPAHRARFPGTGTAEVRAFPALEIVSVHGATLDAVDLGILAARGVVLTGDVADFTVEARQAMAEQAVANLAAWFGGRAPLPPVAPVAHPGRTLAAEPHPCR